jgi:hypothetical protein
MTDGQVARPTTGHERVDAALADLDRASAGPPGEQVAAFTRVHRELQETLAELDEER